VHVDLSRREARRFLLSYQCLLPPRRLRGVAGVRAYMERVRCIQYDPLNIVGRNPELVLQSRVAGFTPPLLDALLYEERAFVDGWDKQMAIFPVEDWPFFARHRARSRREYGPGGRGAAGLARSIHASIRERGPLSSLDLDQDAKVDWHWGPSRAARAALESMFWWGELVIHHRVNTRKVYDLAERHIPARLLSAPDPNTTLARYHERHVLRRIRSVGFLWSRPGEVWSHIVGSTTAARGAALRRLSDAGEVVTVHVEGIERPLFMASEDLPVLEESMNARIPGPRAALIAPLDNLLWDRGMIRSLFDFDYVWEVYKPASKRRFGYYTLPVLHGDRFVARLDAAREGARLVIRGWWWEEGVEHTDALRGAISACLRDFLRFTGTEELRVPAELARRAGLGWLRP
jgi:uncharacterized protein